MCVSGPLTDSGTVWLARRNQGVYEPEFRIFFVGPMLFGVFGYAGWAGTMIAFSLKNKTPYAQSRLITPSWYYSQYALDRSSGLHRVRCSVTG